MHKLLLIVLLFLSFGCGQQNIICDLGLKDKNQCESKTQHTPNPPPPEQRSVSLTCSVTPKGIHRLNNVEYRNTLNSLFDLSFDPTDGFPKDTGANGFLNVAEGMNLSDVFVEKHYVSVERVAKEVSQNLPTSLKILSDSSCLTNPSIDDQCAQSTLESLAKYIFRRPATQQEIEKMRQVYQTSKAIDGLVATGFEGTLTSLLSSPNFLYRSEFGSATDADKNKLSDYELASRLSYFLWSDMPDDALFKLAEESKLSDSQILKQQLMRMLSDAKAMRFIEQFVGQWLSLTKLKDVQKTQANSTLSPELRQAMLTETQLLFKSFIDDKKDFRTFLTADHTYLNSTLATHYGYEGMTGSSFIEVAIQNTEQRGFLAHASFHTVSSHPDESSPVIKGKFVLSNLLCSPPPPPPPNVDTNTSAEDLATQSKRQRISAHSQNPACASCHQTMDPIGFGLENFDLIGRWRDSYSDGVTVDASGQLPDGQSFSTASELATILSQDERFPKCVVKKLVTYSLGRTLSDKEQCLIDSMSQKFSESNYDLLLLIEEIVFSGSFNYHTVTDTAIDAPLDKMAPNTPSAALSFDNDIKPLMQSDCIACHGGSSKVPLTNYQQVTANVEQVVSAIEEGRMPPSGPWSTTNIEKVKNWKQQGLTE